MTLCFKASKERKRNNYFSLKNEIHKPHFCEISYFTSLIIVKMQEILPKYSNLKAFNCQCRSSKAFFRSRNL